MSKIALEKNDKFSSVLLIISILNFAIWLVTGWLFLFIDFAEYEIIIPMFILLLNSIVAITIFIFGACFLRRTNNIKLLIAMLISAILNSIVFTIIYRNWSSIIDV